MSQPRERGAQVKIGGVVAWADAPSGALAQCAHGRIYLRVTDYGWSVGDTGHVSCAFGRYCDGEEDSPWLWGVETNPLTILATGLTGSETVETLRMLVEHYQQEHSQ